MDRPAAYLRVVVLNGCRELARRRRAEDARMRLEAPENVDWIRTDVELLSVVASLPYRLREVLVMRYWLDLRDDQIAAELGVRPATVRTRTHRALTRLRKEIDQVNDTVLEQRLRDAFSASADAMSPALGLRTDADGHGPLGRPVHHASQQRHGRWRHAGLLVATIALIVGVAAVATRGTSTATRPVAVPADAPQWYRTLRTLLPEGFDRVAVSVAEPTVFFWILNEHGDVLVARMSRTPVPDDPSGVGLPKTVDADGTWFEQNGTFNLQAVSGTQVQAGCVLSRACHLPSGPLDDADVRRFVSNLADHFPVADLPTASSGQPDEELLAAGTRILGERLTGATMLDEHPTPPGAVVAGNQWTARQSTRLDRSTILVVVGGLYPAPPASTPLRMSDRVDGRADMPDMLVGPIQISTAVFASGTVVRIVSNDPDHLDDIDRALDDILLAAH